MRAAALLAPGILELEELPDPECPGGGALIKTGACSVCGTDVKLLQSDHKDLTYPRILGHEVVGKVVESSSDIVRGGDYLQVWPGIACGRCRPCLRSADNQCESMRILGFNMDGGFAQMLALPPESLPRGVNIIGGGCEGSLLTLAEPLACCLNAQDLAGIGPGDTVLIIGGGPTGCLHSLLARQRGAEKVLVSEKLENRLRLVRRISDRAIDASSEDLGEVVAEETGGRGVDAVLMATPDVKVDNSMLRLMAPRGRISIFSGPRSGNVSEILNLGSIHYRELSMIGAYGCPSYQNRKAVDLIQSRSIDLEWLVTKRTPLERIGEAFDHAAERRGMKAVVEF